MGLTRSEQVSFFIGSQRFVICYYCLVILVFFSGISVVQYQRLASLLYIVRLICRCRRRQQY